MASQGQTIFISYASIDRNRVDPYADWLERNGFEVWIDHKKIKGGQNWDFEIKSALDKAALVILFVSKDSTDRDGYAQREIKLSLQKAEEKPFGETFIIPVLLDQESKIPYQLKEIQCIKSWVGDAQEAIKEAINVKLKGLGAEVREIQDLRNLTWTNQTYKESWDGLPGYKTEFNWYEFSSSRYPDLKQISAHVYGDLLAIAMEQRKAKFNQDGNRFSFGQQKSSHTNMLAAYSGVPSVVGNILSIQYSIHSYGAGAAHPNMQFRTYAFFMAPVAKINGIHEAFLNPDTVFPHFQEMVRHKLMTEPSGRGPESTKNRDINWVRHGTESWADFTFFKFEKATLELFFPPYQIDSYSAGPQFASLNYVDLIDFMRKEFVDSLELRHLIKPSEFAAHPSS